MYNLDKYDVYVVILYILNNLYDQKIYSYL